MIAISEPVVALTQGLRHLPQVTSRQATLRGKAPSFAAIANMSSTIKTALHAFLSTPHEKCRTSY
jgi:hypothetical protein